MIIVNFVNTQKINLKNTIIYKMKVFIDQNFLIL